MVNEIFTHSSFMMLFFGGVHEVSVTFDMGGAIRFFHSFSSMLFSDVGCLASGKNGIRDVDRPCMRADWPSYLLQHRKILSENPSQGGGTLRFQKTAPHSIQ